MLHRVWPLGLLVICLALLGLGLPAQPAAAKNTYSYDFEQTDDVKLWTVGPGNALGLDFSDSYCPVDDGYSMGRLAASDLGKDLFGALEGPGQEARAYVSASFPILPTDMVQVAWAAKAEGSCTLGNCVPLVYVGKMKDLATAPWVSVNGKAGFNGWWTYQYEAHPALSANAPSAITVGLGVSQFGPYYPDTALGLDCLRIRIMPSGD